MNFSQLLIGHLLLAVSTTTTTTAVVDPCWWLLWNHSLSDCFALVVAVVVYVYVIHTHSAREYALLVKL